MNTHQPLLFLAILGLSTACGAGTGSSSMASAHHDQPSDVTFQPPTELACGNGATGNAIVTGDFNGDHRPDLVACRGATNVALFMNQGDGTFASADLVDVPDGVVEAHDIDGDGKDDLVVVTKPPQDASLVPAVIMLSHGDGSFAPPFQQAAFPSVYCDIGKYSFDGSMNAVCWDTDQNAREMLTVYDVSRDGSSQQLFTMRQTTYPAFADVDGDGNLDLIAASNIEPNNVIVQLGFGRGSFGLVHVVAQTAGSVQRIVATDIDGDGRPDLAAYIEPDTGPTVVEIIHNDGSLAFETWNAVESLNADKFADVTGDGLMDDVQSQGGQLGILVGKGDGTFNPTEVLLNGQWNQAADFVDLNGDGTPDIVGANGDGTVSVVLRQ